jgi:hypothetical protein
MPERSCRVPVAWRATFADRTPLHLLSERTKIVDGYFRWSDPFPALQFYCLFSPLRRIKRGWKATKALKSLQMKC